MSNFVFHSEYIEGIPADRLAEFEHFIIQYGLNSIEPKLEGFEQTFWLTIKRRIDGDKNYYRITCLKRKISAINSRNQHGKATENDLKNLEQFKQELNELSQNVSYVSFNTNTLVLNELNEKSRVKRTHHDNDSDYDSDYDSDIDYDYDSDSDTDIDTDALKGANPSLFNYSKKVFSLLKDAGLPCCKGNEMNFHMQDFSNAMRYLHQTKELNHLHSDDVIGAVENYIKVIKAPNTWVTSKMNFFSLVKSKMFYNLLPANFEMSNYIKETESSGEEKKQEIDDKYLPAMKCKKCGKEIKLNPTTNKFTCSCGFFIKFEEVTVYDVY